MKCNVHLWGTCIEKETQWLVPATFNIIPLFSVMLPRCIDLLRFTFCLVFLQIHKNKVKTSRNYKAAALLQSVESAFSLAQKTPNWFQDRRKQKSICLPSLSQSLPGQNWYVVFQWLSWKLAQLFHIGGGAESHISIMVTPLCFIWYLQSCLGCVQA